MTTLASTFPIARGSLGSRRGRSSRNRSSSGFGWGGVDAAGSGVACAASADAVAVCANLMQLPGHPAIRDANIRSIMALREQATRYAMPLMIEPLVMQDNATAGGGYMVDGDTAKVVTLVRQAVEGRRATTGSSCRKWRTSAASPLAVS